MKATGRASGKRLEKPGMYMGLPFYPVREYEGEDEDLKVKGAMRREDLFQSHVYLKGLERGPWKGKR